MSEDAYLKLLALQDKHKPRKRPSHQESTLQQHCHRYFCNTHRDLASLYFSIPNGAHVTKTHAKILKSEGLTDGVADTFLSISRGGWHGLYIEYKREFLEYDEKTQKLARKKTYQRPEQREWQRLVENRDTGMRW